MEEVRQRQAVFGLVRQAMPKVVELMVSQRREKGDAWVTECQRRGMSGEAGWFYAWEAGLAVGTPWPEALAMLASVDPRNAIPTKAIVVLRPREAADGAH